MDRQEWSVVNPVADADIEKHGGATRLDDFSGKRIGLWWNGKPNGDIFLNEVAHQLESLHPGVTADVVLARIRNLCRAHAPGATVRVHRTGPSFVTERAQPWARKLRGAGCGWAKADWFCDANIFAGHGIPAVAFGPGDIAQAHTKDEYIHARDLVEGAAAFGRFLNSGGG